jgi:FtsZ-binding cell division protein ZapB
MSDVATVTDREQFIRDNAVAVVSDLEAKVKRQAETITRLETSRNEMRRHIEALRNLVNRLGGNYEM